MTKREIEKCENLMHEAIRYAKESKEGKRQIKQCIEK